jgi:hypothetical protein
MNSSSHALDGAPQFTVKVEQAEGGYKATAPALPRMAPVIAPTEAQAVHQLKKAIHDSITQGKF